MRAPRIRHQLFLPVPLSERLEAMAARPGASKSAILADALEAWINRRTLSELEDRFEQRLNRISATVGRCERNDQVVLETLAVFIRYSLNVNPPLADHDKAGHARGRARFEDFVALVGEAIASGKRTLAPPPLAALENKKDGDA